MKKIIFAALLAVIAAVTQAKDGIPDIKVARVGGTNGLVALLKQTENTDGTTFTIVGKSTLPFAHLMGVQYRHLPGVAGEAAGFTDLALAFTDYFDGSSTTHNASKLITARQLNHGDSLYVKVTITAADDSTAILDTLERGYLIQHPVWQGDKAFCIVALADDGYASNLGWATAADSMGFTYTMAPSTAPTYGIGSANFLTFEQVNTLYSNGVIEIGYTGDRHPTNGIMGTTHTNVAYTDTLGTYLDPALLEDVLGIDVAPKSWSVDAYGWNYLACKMLRDYGYESAVGGLFYTNNATYNTSERLRGFFAWTEPGWGRFDLFRPLNWYEPSNLFAIGAWAGELTTYPSIFGANAAGPTDSTTIAANVAAACDSAAAHGFAPIIFRLHGATVTREDVENLIEYCRVRGDVWITNVGAMTAYYRARHEVVPVPHWAWYAKLDGVTESDSLFWGFPEDPVVCASTDSTIFHSGTTAVTAANYTASVTGPHGWGQWNNGFPTTRVSTSPASIQINLPPLDLTPGTQRAIGLGFTVSSLYGKTVKSATLAWRMSTGTTSATGEFGCNAVVGITHPDILPFMDNHLFTLTYADSAQTDEWDTAITSLQRLESWGPYVYPRAGGWPTGWVTQDVTEYVRKIVDDQLDVAGFCFWGMFIGSPITVNMNLPFDTTTAYRPYLVVRTCAE